MYKEDGAVRVIFSLSSLLLLEARLWHFFHVMSIGLILQVRGCDGMSTPQNGVAAYSQSHVSRICKGGFPLLNFGVHGTAVSIFFSNRVIIRWNQLDQRAVGASSINAFKGCLNKIRKTRMGFFMD